MKPNIFIHKGDLPDGFVAGEAVAVDTETMGLHIQRDRLCLVQISNGDDSAHIVQINRTKRPHNLLKIFTNKQVIKIFHFARFDVSKIYQEFDVALENIYCTKIASRLCRTYTDKHGLKELCRELLGIELNKQEQSSDWGASELKASQLEYAANDVLFLHGLKSKLDVMLARENRTQLAQTCFEFLATRAKLDAMGFENVDIFAHT